MKPKQFFEKCLREISKGKLVLDIGGGTPFQKEMAQYKEWFKDCEYLTVDQEVYKPSVVADIHDLPFDDKYSDAAICKAVLEHVCNPFEVVDEIYRVLKTGGKLLVWLPFFYPYHGNKEYKDYYHYSRDGVEYLFRRFKEVEIMASKGYFETLLGFVPFLGKYFAVLGRPLDRLIKVNNCQSGFYVFCKK